MSLVSPGRSLPPAKRLLAFCLTIFAAALLLAAASPSARADATVTGTVATGANAGIDGATVTACPWTEGAFKCENDGGVLAGALRGPVALDVGPTDVPSTTTAADGTFTLTIAPGTTYTLLATRASYAPGFLGGGGSMPLIETGQHSFSATDGQMVSGKDIHLSPRVTALGQGAGVDEPWCKTNSLGPGEDSAEISAPFTIDFYGEPGDDLSVSEDGRILFGGSYSPGESLATTTNAQIAPFGADVDTADPFKSNQVTWGVSPDQKQLCVTWAGVKQYIKDGEPDAGLVNTFQVLLTDRSGADGRPAGDFDITFNYDEIQWDSTNRRYDPFDEIPAVAGFTNGTMAPNTFLVLPGSGTSGALKNGGANQLVAGSHNAATPGRYIYEIRNDDVANEPWTLSGDVTYLNERPDNGTPVVNAWVRATMIGHESRSHMARTDSNGHYTLSGLAPGSYSVRASAPTGDDISAQGIAEMVNGESTTLDFQIKPTLGVPSGVAVSTDLFGTVNEGGKPRVNWHDPIKLRIESDQCLVRVKYTMRDSNGAVIKEEFLTEIRDPANNQPPPWIFEGSIAPVYPSHGNATIELIKTPCGPGGQGEGPEITQGFSVYIDPSGVIVDQWGFPVVGATVTLQRADAFEGPYEDVPDGSDIMEATNRDNPMTTGAGGLFGWDVIAGWYRVSATKVGYETGQSAIMQVAPERVGLFVKLGGGTAPAYNSTLSGGAAVGQTLSLTAPAGMPDGFAPVGHQWSRDGAVIAEATGASYTLTAADAGHNVAGAVVFKHADVVADEAADPKVKVSFTAFGAWSAAVAVPAPAAAPATEPAAAPKLAKLKKINYKKKITVKFSCPEGCVLTLGLKIGKRKVKTFKTVKLKAGAKQYSFKLPKKYVRQLQKAFKKSKRTKAALQVQLSNTLKNKHDTSMNSIRNVR